VTITAPAPTVKTEPASSVAKTTAALKALVNPNGSEVAECRLEYERAPRWARSCTPRVRSAP
jgi:hypothetical protein